MITKPILPLYIFLPLLILGFGFFLYFARKAGRTSFHNWSFFIRSILLAILLFLVNLRPMVPSYTTDVLLKNIDVLIVVDNTISMYAKDDKQTRMEHVQSDIAYLLDELDGSNFGLIRFDNRSQILAPFTQDTRTISDALDVMRSPDIYYALGSSMNTPYEDMEELLLSTSQKESRMSVLLYLSDGEIIGDDSLRSFSDLASYVDIGAVIGYGTTSGGTMQVYNYGYYETVNDPTTGKPAISKLDESTLQTLAKDLGISYFKASERASWDKLIHDILEKSSAYIGESQAVNYEDIYYYFAAGIFLLGLWEAYLFIRKERL